MKYLNSLLKPRTDNIYLLLFFIIIYRFRCKNTKICCRISDSLAGNLAVAGLVIAMLCKGRILILVLFAR